VGGLIIPVAISFSSILSDKNVVSNTAVILVLQSSKTTTTSSQQKIRQQLQQKSTSTGIMHHRRIVFLEESSSAHTMKVAASAIRQVEPMTTSDACPYCRVEADIHRWPFEERFYKDCEPIMDWQSMSFPTCNLLHQLDMIPQLVAIVVVPTATNAISKYNYFATTSYNINATTSSTTTTTTAVLSPSLLSTAGSWRTVWTVQDTATAIGARNTSVVVAKFLKFTHRNFTHEAYEKHNTDALVMEHLTASPYMLNAHAYCGQSVITEHADTEIRSYIKRSDFGSRSRLKLAQDMAGALAVLQYRDDIMASSSATNNNTTTTSTRPLRATIAHVRRESELRDIEKTY
jgi:hypothetical protein